MADILERLNQIPERLSDKAFLNNQGLFNEVGIHCSVAGIQPDPQAVRKEMVSGSPVSFGDVGLSVPGE